MAINCFCAARPSGSHPIDEAPRRVASFPPTGPRTKKASFRRHGHNGPPSRTSSNSSIAQLPPCDRNPKIEALMMPVPPDPRPSRCLRVSYPRIYGDIVSDMKVAKGCRDWRNFAVFHDNEVDMSVSAEQYARKRAQDYERKMREFSSFSSDEFDVSLDTIG